MKKYLMGIDGGVASLALALIELDDSDNPCKIFDGTVRIFEAANATEVRRQQKSAMRQHKRKSQRLEKTRELLKTIFDDEGMPLEANFHQYREPKKAKELVEYRALAAQHRAESLPLARVLYYLMHNRGMRLVREEGSGKMLKANREMLKTIKPDNEKDYHKTVGEFLAELSKKHESIKARPNAAKERGFIATRKDIRAELMKIFETQKKYYPTLEEKSEQLFALFDFENKATTPSRGECCYQEHGEEERLRRVDPLAQDKILYEQIANIRVYSKEGKMRPQGEGKLTLKEREKIFNFCREKIESKATQIEKHLGLVGEYDLQLPAKSRRMQKSARGTEKEASLKGNQFLVAIRKMSLGAAWEGWDEQERREAVKILLEQDDMDETVSGLTPLLPEMERKEIEDILTKLEKFPRALTHVGESATKKLLQAFKDGAENIKDAEQRGGLKHKEDWEGVLYDEDRLPYYGHPQALRDDCIGATRHPADPLEERYGRMPNRVVHRFLNELRKTVNLYIKKYGKPEKIHVELGRELSKGQEERDEIERNNQKARKKNEDYDRIIREYRKEPSRKYRRKLRLFEAQKSCPYTGRNFAQADIFDGTTDLDHILPRSTTHDDSLSNLVLCDANINKHKNNRPPYEAFGPGCRGTDTKGRAFNRSYNQILTDVNGNKGAYPPAKAWRFKEDAMKRYEDNPNDRWQRRFLSDNAYAAKRTRRYLLPLMGKPERIVCLSGGLTSELRHQWGLHNLHTPSQQAPDYRQQREEAEKKKREDNRHHLVDAITIACTSSGHIQRLQTHYARKEQHEKPQFEPPWQNFRADVEAFLENPACITQRSTRLKIDRTTGRTPPAGELHEETNYGRVAQLDGGECVYRLKRSIVDLLAVTTPKKANKDKKKTKKEIKQEIKEGIEEKLSIHPNHRALIVKAFVQQQKDGKKRLFWGGESPTLKEIEAQLNAAEKRLTSLKEEIFDTWGRQPSQDEEGKALSEKQRLQEAINMLGDKTDRKTRRRRYTEFGVRSLVPVGKTERFVWARNNAWMDVWQDKNFDWQWGVQKLFDSTVGKKMPWQNFDGSCKEGYRLLMRLQKLDTVEMESGGFACLQDKSPHRVLAYVRKISEGDIFFWLLQSATEDKRHIHRIASLKAFKLARIEPVIRDAIGREITRKRDKGN